MLYNNSTIRKNIYIWWKNDKKINSIEKTLDLIELFSDNKEEIGVTEIGKTLNMGLSTVYRILATLKDHGYIF